MRMRYMLFLPAALMVLAFASTGNAFVPPEKALAAESEVAGIALGNAPPTQASGIKWSAFLAGNGDEWRAAWNPVTDTPHRVYGKGIRLTDQVSPANVEGLVQAFVEDKADLLGVDMERLRLVRQEKHGARWYTNYQQVYNGLDVVGGKVHVRLRENGKVTVFGSDFFQDLAISTTPALSDAEAILRAKTDTEFDSRSDEVLSSRLVVFPEVRGDHALYRLAYEVRVRVADGPAIWRLYIDANDGTTLSRSNEIYYDTIDGTVTGNIKQEYITDPDQEEEFGKSYIDVAGYGQATADDYGYYAIEVGTGGLRGVTALIRGTWVRVTNNDGPEASFADSVAPGSQADILWDNSNSIASERNAYYHINVVHEKIKSIDPSYTGMDRQIPVRVNQPDYCNAYWDGSGITLGAGSGTCNDLAMFCDIIYHEYGHGIVDYQYRPYSPSGAMHEAFADYTACMITNEPQIGEGVITGGNFRSMDNNLRYPDDLTGEVHDDGRILGGALWDLREALSPDVHLADSLWHFARYGLAENFFDYYYDVIETDDDDGDLSNGTPHYDEIVEAFGAHGIGPGLYINVAHSPVRDTEDSTETFPVAATITGNMTLDPDSLLLFYDTGGGYTQTTMLATANPDEYAATIPEQAVGTSVSYYIYARALGRDDVVTDPEGAPSVYHSFSIGDDGEAPVITHTALDDQPDAGWPSTVSADVVDNLGLATVVLEYSVNGAVQTPIAMTDITGTDTYEAEFGGTVSSGDYIEYRIVATDASSSSHVATEPAGDYHLFGIAAADDFTFESGEQGWTHRTTSGWTDEWHLSTDRNHTPGGGTSWKCGSSTGGNYSPNSKGLLESPMIDISEGATLVFWHWIDAETYEPVEGSGIAWDGAGVSFVDSAGVAAPIDPVEGYPYRMIPGTGAPFTDNKPVYSGQHDWQMAVFELPDYSGLCQLRLKFGSDGYVAGEGWYVDDVMIWSGGVIAGACDDVCNDLSDTPVRFSLGLALPNPSRGMMAIAYAVPWSGSHVSIKVFDITGRLTATLVDEHKMAGRYMAGWDGMNASRRRVAPGTYFVRMEGKDFSESSKLILLK